MSWNKGFFKSIQLGQWILIAVGLLSAGIAVIIGIADNIPGVILLMVGLACGFGAWIWNWRSPRYYWILLGSAILSFPVGVVLHNLFYALGTLVAEIKILAGILGFIEVIFFLLAVLVAGPAALAALLGGIIASWRGVTRIAKANRSIRRFVQKKEISTKHLEKLVNLTRLSASGSNRQPLKYILSNTADKNQLIFPTLSWAGYLKDWDRPDEGEKPSAYIILLGDQELGKSFGYDAGIACQSMLLGATEIGLGGCIIGSINKDTLRDNLSIPERYEILLVLALGKPGERVVIEDINSEGDIQYWRDEYDIHHVPKRSLEELILDL
ncbi:MAG: nitroreductase family protein [Anaerolineales bacterium]